VWHVFRQVSAFHFNAHYRHLNVFPNTPVLHGRISPNFNGANQSRALSVLLFSVSYLFNCLHAHGRHPDLQWIVQQAICDLISDITA